MVAKKTSKKATPKLKTVAKVKSSLKAKPVAKKQSSKPLGKITKPLTKSELYSILGDSAELSRKQVSAIFDTLSEAISAHLKNGPEKFVLPGLLKIVVKKVPARPARKGVNPFTGEAMTFKAKPASKKVKVVALRALKEMC